MPLNRWIITLISILKSTIFSNNLQLFSQLFSPGTGPNCMFNNTLLINQDYENIILDRF